MSRQHGTPYFVTDTTSRSLQPVEELDEKWLQKFIFAHPQSLPVDEIEPAFGPLIPVCQELGTPAGPVDILFINTTGLVTLVECKLWKNPEARREVVGQILDYAKEISRWNYAELEGAINKTLNKREGRSLYELVSQYSEELDQSEFIDNVSRYLKRGRFLLLIVGNGIRESVELIAEFLQEHAHLNFGFALIEVGVFQVPPDFGTGYFVQPRIIAQTVEIERAVVRIEDGKLVAESFPKSDHTTLVHWLPNPFMLSVARRAQSKQAHDWICRPSTSLRYAQDERDSIPLWVNECTNVLWSDLGKEKSLQRTLGELRLASSSSMTSSK